MKLAYVAAGLMVFLTWSEALADVIQAAPGEGTLAAAIAKSKDGDTVKLAAGVYTDSVEVPEGVAIEGAGADITTLVATGYAAINCKGARVRITGIAIKPGERTVRGVNSSMPVRVERCRFHGVKEGVALMLAPLSDVVGCEFLDCGIGVRAIGEACPTVWGCVFKGGGIGVFVMDGMPYIRNNVFAGPETGIKMVVGDGGEQPIVRNNLFLDCKQSGIEISSRGEPIFGPSIRNNIFERGGGAIIAASSCLSATSHCVVHEIAQPAFRDKSGKETLKLGDHSTSEAAPGVEWNDGNITYLKSELVDGKGLRCGSDPEGHAGQIGPESAWRRPGPSASGELPPARWNAPLLIANAVREEYQYLQLRGVRSEQQSVGVENGKRIDTMTYSQDGKEGTIKFDISRFFGEMGVGD